MKFATVLRRAHGSRSKVSLTALLGLSLGLMASASGLMADTKATALDAPVPTVAAPATPKSRLSEGVVATVNDDIISSYDLRQRLMLLVASSGVQITNENFQTYEQQALRDLIDERLEFQEMKRFDLKIDDAEVNEELSRIAGQSNMNIAQLATALKANGIDISTMRNQIRANMGWNQLVAGRFRSKAKVGQDQVDAVMGKMTADSQKPQYEVAEIFLDPTSHGGTEQTLAGAEQLFDQLAKGEAPFNSVARQFSNGPTAQQGGELGWVVSGSLNPKLETVLAAMEKGQMSRPIETDDGVYILFLRDKSAGTDDALVSLKQAAIRLDANASEAQIARATKALESFRANNRGCKALGNAHPGDQIVVSDLGETQLSELAPTYASALKAIKENESTPVLRNAINLNVVYMCDKSLVGDNAPTKDQIEQRMVDQRLGMLGRRYLRDLRQTATIETK